MELNNKSVADLGEGPKGPAPLPLSKGVNNWAPHPHPLISRSGSGNVNLDHDFIATQSFMPLSTQSSGNCQK